MHRVLMPLLIAAAALAAGKPAMPPAQREAELFRLLNLDFPGLEAVKAAEAAGDRERAKRALVGYYRHRKSPPWPIDPDSRPKHRTAKPNTAAADRTLRREFVGMGRAATLTYHIDWDANPLDDVEWTVDLNQHGYWRALGRAYWQTLDEKYAKDFVVQLRDWLDAYPRLDWRPFRRAVWRSTLRAGVRMCGVWLDVWCYFADSPSFTIQDRISMLHSIAQHADYLLQSRSGGNWRLTECSGLFTVAVMFPEFKDAETWRKTAIDTLYRELTAQVYPDGAQAELTPHYHGCCVGAFLRPLRLAKKLGISMPADYLGRMEKMFDYFLYLGKPDLHIPMLNDSDYGSTKGWMAQGAELFGRDDMRYAATGGKAGVPPSHTSHPFPYAGFYVMRSGWDRDARYLLLEAGPYGLGHQHEDKLQIDVSAYGRPLLMDPGRFTYAPNKWRRYFVGTQSHNTIMVDGRGQDRRHTDRSLWVIDQPNDNRWVSNAAFDYAVGSYTDGYGSGADVVHVRRVLFVKPDYWIVSDRLYEAAPGKKHEFASQFQFSAAGATVHPKSKIAQSHNSDSNLLIAPAAPEQFRPEVVEGQTDPPRGWIGWSYHRDLKTPASMVTYRWRAVCPASADMVLYPYRGERAPKVTVTRLAGHGPGVTALEITRERGVDRVLLQHRAPRLVKLGDLSTDAEVALLRCDAHGRLASWAAVDGAQMVRPPAFKTRALPAAAELLAEPIQATAVDEHTATITWVCREPVEVTVRYGHEVGGGWLFEKRAPEGPQLRGSLILANLTIGLPYVFRATATRHDARPVLLGEGRFVTAPPSAFDFETGDVRRWGSPRIVGRVAEGVAPGRWCLKASQPPTAAKRYLSARRAVRWTVTPKSRIAFDYRADAAHPGSYYFKVNLGDDRREDWAVYLDHNPSGRWRHADLAMTNFRADTYRHKNRAAKLPAGARMTRLCFTQCKGQAAQPCSQTFWVDNVRLYEPAP